MNENIQTEIENLLRETKRSGINNVIEYLRNGAFYSVPASVAFHNNFKGGLAKHSLDVYLKSIELYNELKSYEVELPFDKNSVTLCSLLHDVCKMDEYTINMLGQVRHTKIYYENINNNKLLLHGIKSIDILLNCELELTKEEIKAIHWHMGVWAKDTQKEYGHSYFVASVQSILVNLIHTADSLAAHTNKNIK